MRTLLVLGLLAMLMLFWFIEWFTWFIWRARRLLLSLPLSLFVSAAFTILFGLGRRGLFLILFGGLLGGFAF
ncbi:hypothetical protein CONLIGDRAFT_631841 [Coniochaeta ligniaria NRRL 30616]|uniref:Uncharacterized protein n=1 Tax=Coniochaeta ligniaria NRRL 30616 TaxID=1408157 RepID=A0A1J7IQ66_9PEZI|nr:hypothetical protein CONLIGDRAFT_631841 [Coniochaeta ligniaria NRRL 30616]